MEDKAPRPFRGVYPLGLDRYLRSFFCRHTNVIKKLCFGRVACVGPAFPSTDSRPANAACNSRTWFQLVLGAFTSVTFREFESCGQNRPGTLSAANVVIRPESQRTRHDDASRRASSFAPLPSKSETDCFPACQSSRRKLAGASSAMLTHLIPKLLAIDSYKGFLRHLTKSLLQVRPQFPGERRVARSPAPALEDHLLAGPVSTPSFQVPLLFAHLEGLLLRMHGTLCQGR